MAYEAPKHGFRTFVIVWLSQSASVLGSALTVFALQVWLTKVAYPLPEQKPQLAMAISATMLCHMVPMLLFAPIAGAWADRHDRKRTMMMTDVASALVSLTLMALLASGHLTVGLLLPLVVLASTLAAFHQAAFDTSYVMLVPKEQLPRANGMMMTIWSLANVLAPGLAAALISLPALARSGHVPGAVGEALAGLTSGTALAAGVDAATFLLAATTLLFLHIPSPKRTDLGDGGPKKSIWADVREGAVYIWRRRPILWLLGTFTMANLLLAPVMVYLPLIVKFNLAADWTARGMQLETALATLSTASGVGGLLAGILVSLWGGLRRRRINGVIIPMIASGLGVILLGFAPTLYIAAAAVFLTEAQVPIMNAHSQSIWQTQVPPELQGRVFAVRRVIAQGSLPLMAAMAGWLAGIFNPGMVLAVLGAVMALFCLVQLFNPYLMRVEDREWLESLAARATATRGA